jgi:hypothetical protein
MDEEVLAVIVRFGAGVSAFVEDIFKGERVEVCTQYR